jgi:ferredoxin-NADP reductase/MOSC domain-containing protein YiiM
MVAKLGKYVTPPFTHYDAYPIHFLTSATLGWLQQNNPDAQIDVRRFRPNFLIDTLTQPLGFVEKQWVGGYLEIGSVVIKVECPAIRCSMPAQAQPELRKDSKVANAIRLTAKQFVGSYATVIEGGDIFEGDAIKYRSASKFAKVTANLQKNVRQSVLATALSVLDKKQKKQLATPVKNNTLNQGFTQFKVHKKIRESENVTSFYLTPQSNTQVLPYLAGQHIMLALNIPGENVPVMRAYSLSQDSHEGNSYRISVKRETGPENCDPSAAGKASNYLHDQVHDNDSIHVKGPAGQFYLPPKELISATITKNKPVALISMGIGITPMFTMLENAIQSKHNQKLYFIHGTQNKSSHLFKNKLKVYEKIVNVKMHTAYSQPNATDVWGVDYHDHGRISIDLIRKIIPNRDTHFYLCGTEIFMQGIYDGLIDWGVNKDNIHYESFKKSKPLGVIEDTGLSYDVLFKRSNIKSSWSPASGSLLDLAEECGITPEYGCRYGACEACSASLISGQVDHDDNIAELKTERSILLCSARPSSDIEIDL